MKKNHRLAIDNLAVGLTKPATHLGVPLLSFYLNGMTCFLGWILLQAITHSGLLSLLVFALLFLAIHAWMAWVTFKDHFGLRIAGLHFTVFSQHRSYCFWNNTDSFAP